MLTRTQKKEIVESLTQKLKDQTSGVLLSAQGIKVKDSEELRTACYQDHMDFMVIKKKLLALALEQANVAVDITSMTGLVGVALGYGEEVIPAKVLSKFAKNNKNVIIFSGILNDAAITPAQVENLAKLPDTDTMRAMVLGTLNAPVTSFVGVLQANIRNFVFALNQIAANK